MFILIRDIRKLTVEFIQDSCLKHYRDLKIYQRIKWNPKTQVQTKQNLSIQNSQCFSLGCSWDLSLPQSYVLCGHGSILSIQILACTFTLGNFIYAQRLPELESPQWKFNSCQTDPCRRRINKSSRSIAIFWFDFMLRKLTWNSSWPGFQFGQFNRLEISRRSENSM